MEGCSCCSSTAGALFWSRLFEAACRWGHAVWTLKPDTHTLIQYIHTYIYILLLRTILLRSHLRYLRARSFVLILKFLLILVFILIYRSNRSWMSIRLWGSVTAKRLKLPLFHVTHRWKLVFYFWIFLFLSRQTTQGCAWDSKIRFWRSQRLFQFIFPEN